ncbi:MAG: hypothetical protein E7515_07500 [Ruminococcaceae bacterium]|jgi:hypothetical protein|nr:hypothetical protein [Oscillospiraceae bacterium]
MKKMFAIVVALVMAVCALSIIDASYDTTPEKVIIKSETANAIATSSADLYTADRQDYPVGLNEENQYDILAENELYGHADYGDYVPAEVRYVDGFPVVDGEKTYNSYYGSERYVDPGEQEKPREDWNLHDYHKNGEFFESVGHGAMYFNSVEDMQAYAQMMKEEFGENIHDTYYDVDGNQVDRGSSLIDNAEAIVGDVNSRQQDTLDAIDAME